MSAINPDRASLEKKIFRKIKKMKIAKSDRNCVFCIENFKVKEIIKVLPCKHYFHYACCKVWFGEQMTCPVCKLDVKKYFDDESEDEFKDE